MLRRLMAAALAATGLAAAGLVAAPAHAAPAKPPSCDPGYCFTVDVKLDRAPAVGQTATLTVGVTAKEDLPNATTIIELPETLRWVRPPAGLAHAPATIGRSPVDRASRTERARRGTPVRYEGIVTAVAPGPASIRVQARDGRPGPSSEGLAYLTIGEKSSIFGMPPDDRGPRAQAPATSGTWEDDTCVQGRVKHIRAEDGAVRGVPGIRVTAFDADGDGPDRLGATFTDDAGDYQVCFPGADEDGTGQDVYIEVSSANDYWEIVKPGDGTDYAVRSDVRQDVPRGSALSVIDYEAAPGSPAEGAFRIFTAAHETWKAYTGWLNQPGNECWKPGEASCRKVTVIWAPDRVVPLSYYCPGAYGTDCSKRFEIHLDASVALSKMTVAHELGHFIMDYTYDGMPPYDASCDEHYVKDETTPACAWSEGWADWVAVQTYDDTHLRWGPTDPAIDIESPTWFSAGWFDGTDVEGRVAGALLDLADSGPRDEKYWDVGGLGPAGVVAAFRKAPADDIDQFLGGLSAQDKVLAEQVLFQNAIRNTRYEDLFDRKIAHWPSNEHLLPVFPTTAGKWSVVATVASPPNGANVDLYAYPVDHAKVPLSSSDGTASNADFIAVQPASDDDVHVATAVSDVDYQEYALEVAEAPDGDLQKGTPQEITMGADRLVEIRTARIEQGEPATFIATPRDGQDVDLFVMTPNPSVWGLSRAKASRSTGGGPGKAERVSISDPKVSGVYAVIVIRKSGAGNLLLTRT
ncbi:hypothetical protein [Microbispora siamensis]|uniref:Carboxypeptidase regulatory-like domain-containing protein n=1 Tax=Microbispora siamensis TaxID=564413 RepID=A0ABQ4GD40_9ACTN|nr:hypothetical protein [Microbispora siamensis]GIH59339.1 hypothetical protein Msi02_01560 [Microbispora siamensis]